MHGHGSARAERVHYDIFWGESKSGCLNPYGLGLEGCNDVQGADRADLVVGVRVVADRGGSRAPIFAHVEEDVDARSNRTD